MAESILDEAVMAELLLRRYTNASLKELEELLELSEARIIADLQRTQSEKPRQRLRLLLARVNEYYKEPFANFPDALKEEVKEVSEVVHDSTASVLLSHSKELGVAQSGASFLAFTDIPETAIMRVIDFNRPLAGGLLVKDEIALQKAQTLKRVRAEIADGLLRGIGNEEIARNVRRASDRTRRASRSIVRTTTADAMNRARVEAESQFESVVTGYEWSSILDGRTTFGCASLNGKILPTREAFDKLVGRSPAVPRHVNCRSMILPRTKLSDISDEEDRIFALHNKKKVQHRGEPRETSTKFQVKEAGKITLDRDNLRGNQSLSDLWARKMVDGDATRGFIQEYLGPTRYKLWSEGKINFRDMVDSDFEPLTIEQIKKRLSK